MYAKNKQFVEAFEVLSGLPDASRGYVANEMEALKKDYVIDATKRAVLLAIAKHRPCAGRIIAVLIPITSPRVVTSGPPELPGFSDASV